MTDTFRTIRDEHTESMLSVRAMSLEESSEALTQAAIDAGVGPMRQTILMTRDMMTAMVEHGDGYCKGRKEPPSTAMIMALRAFSNAFISAYGSMVIHGCEADQAAAFAKAFEIMFTEQFGIFANHRPAEEKL